MTLGRTAMLRGIWLQIQQRHPSIAAVRDMENQGINGSDSTHHFFHLSKKAWGSWGWVSVGSVPSWSVTWSIEILHLGSARHKLQFDLWKNLPNRQIQLMLGCTCECSHQNAYILGLTKHDLTSSRKLASSSWSPCCFSKVLAGAGIANHSYMVAISIISIISIRLTLHLSRNSSHALPPDLPPLPSPFTFLALAPWPQVRHGIGGKLFGAWAPVTRWGLPVMSADWFIKPININ